MQDTTSAEARPELKIFLSSPGDVNEERVLANRVLARLTDRYAPVARITPVIWEHEPLLASSTFQDQIEKPSATDIVVCVLWSRLGTRLPAHITRDDGTRYDSGTEFEFEDAFEALKRTGRPDLLVYRKMSEPLISLANDVEAEERLRQKRALDGFIQKWFHDQDGSLMAAFHSFGNSAEFEDAFEMHLDKLIQRRLRDMGLDPDAAAAMAADLGTGDAPDWEGSPFRGLETFEFEHAPVFYGRTQAISQVLANLRRQSASGQAFALVLGRSGGGKSSLVRAGVLPLLVEPGVIEGVGLWRRAIFRPSAASGDLFDAFATALVAPHALPELTSDGTTVKELGQMLRDAPSATAPLIKGALSQAAQAAAYDDAQTVLDGMQGAPQEERDTARQAIVSAPPQARLVLLADQLEELFSDSAISDAERTAFLVSMAALARTGRVFVLATLRSDFYHHAMSYPALAELKGEAGQYDLAAPTAAEIGQIIRMPARRAGLHFEEHPDTGARLDDTLRDVATEEPDSLPLLEFTLEELYRERAPNGALTWEAYDRLGGVAGALGRRAEDIFQSLSPAAQDALPRVMRLLVDAGLQDGRAATKRPAALDRFAEDTPAREFVDAFTAARLFVAGTNDAGTPVVAMSHEALLRSWPRLVEWLERDRELLRMRARLAYAARRWEEASRDTQLLLPPGRALDEAQSLQTEGGFDLTEDERDFIVRSGRRQKRARRVKQLAMASLAVLTCLAMGAAWVANDQRALAMRNADIAEAERNTAELERARATENEATANSRLNELFLERGRQAILGGAPQDAMLILGSAYARSGDARSGALFSQARNLASMRAGSVPAHTDAVSVIVTGSDGLTASAAPDGTIALRDQATGAPVATTAMPGTAVRALALSPNGTGLAAAGDSGEILLHDIETGQERTLTGHYQAVTQLLHSPDGTRLASTSDDNTTRIWNLASESSVLELVEPTAPPVFARFLPDRGQVVTVSRDGYLTLWDDSTGARAARQQLGDAGRVTGATLLGATGALAVITDAAEVIVARLDDDPEIAWRAERSARSVSSDDSGQALLLGTDHGMVVLSPQDGQVLQAAPEMPRRRLTGTALSPDGALIAALDDAGDVSISDAASGRIIATISGHDTAGTTLAFGPDSLRLVTGARDGTVTFWDLATVQPCTLTDGPGHAVAFSGDGALVAAGDADGTLHLMDPESCTPHQIHDVIPRGERVQAIAFSPDSRSVAVAGGSDVVLLDIQSGETLWSHSVRQGMFATSVGFSPDGAELVAGMRSRELNQSFDGAWVILDPADGATLQKSAHSDKTSVARSYFSTNPEYLLSENEAGLSLWYRRNGERRHRIVTDEDPAIAYLASGDRFFVGLSTGEVEVLRHTGSDLLIFQAHDTPVTAIATNETGTLLATGARNGAASVWNAQTGQLVARLDAHAAPVEAVTFLPGSGHVAALSRDGRINLSEPATGATIAAFDGPAGLRVRMAAGPDGQWFATASGRGPARLWQVPQPDVPQDAVIAAIEAETPWGPGAESDLPKGQWQTLAFQALLDQSGAGQDSPEALSIEERQRIELGRIAGARGDALAADRAWRDLTDVLPPAYQLAARWNAAALEGLHTTIDTHADRVETIRFAPDASYLVSVDWTGMLLVTDTDGWAERFRLEDGFKGHLAIRPDGSEILATREGGGAVVLDAETGTARLENEGDVANVQWSADGSRFALFPELGPPTLLDADSAQVLASFPDADPRSDAYAIAPDFSAVAQPVPGAVSLIDPITRSPITRLEGPTGTARAELVVFSPDGTQVAVAWSEHSAGIYAATDGTLLHKVEDRVLRMVFSPDGQDLAIELWGSSAPTLLVSTEDWRSRAELKGRIAVDETFLKDSDLVATAVGDTTQGVLLHARDSGALAGAYYGHATGWSRLATARDSRWRVTTSGDGVLRVWDNTITSGLGLKDMLDFTPSEDPTLLAQSSDGMIRIERDPTGHAKLVQSGGEGEVLRTRAINTSKGIVTAAAFADDGSWFLTGEDTGTVQGRNTENGSLIFSLVEACDGSVGDVQLMQRERAVVVRCADDGTKLFAQTTGQLLLRMPTLDQR
ncbi:PQQ-binding-like beta-propeller repeat protein [Roseovarius confluentis]|uniref:nSTAND1 domain-containing NTPase n=1 Tax=Roseovarius confluentis TaxID=1852027 RepID=UPI000CDD13D4|nr:PQQ-binding-like beta-propeller repeat protein [Roseovarius confluentis]